MSFIAYLSGRFVPKLLQLCPDIVNSVSVGRIEGGKTCCSHGAVSPCQPKQQRQERLDAARRLQDSWIPSENGA